MATTGTKYCAECGTCKEVELFVKWGRGYTSTCKECHAKKSLASRKLKESNEKKLATYLDIKARNDYLEGENMEMYRYICELQEKLAIRDRTFPRLAAKVEEAKAQAISADEARMAALAAVRKNPPVQPAPAKTPVVVIEYR